MLCDVCGKRMDRYMHKTDDNLKLCKVCADEELDCCTFCGHSTISYNVVNGLRCGSCRNKED